MVKLISYTTPVDELDEQGISDAQELIAFCARVSNPSNQFNTVTSDKLIRYLIKHKHWSPLEMVDACLELELTRDIGRQLIRHGSFRFQEFSQRYANPIQDMRFVLREARLQDPTNRQKSIKLNSSLKEHRELEFEWKRRQQMIIDMAKDHYNWAVENNIAKEQARCVLPEGNTVSRIYVKGSIRSWIHYIETRTNYDTQEEHRQLALQCAIVLSQIFPMANEFVRGDEPSMPVKKTTWQDKMLNCLKFLK